MEHDKWLSPWDDFLHKNVRLDGAILTVIVDVFPKTRVQSLLHIHTN